MHNEYRIFGPPGTGKTTMLSRLIKDACKRKGSENVTACTFTRAANVEMMSRGTGILDKNVGTMHALCYRALGGPTIITNEMIKHWNKSHSKHTISVRDSSYIDYSSSDKDHMQKAECFRHAMIPVDQWPAPIRSTYQKWVKFKDDANAMDFTDLIEQCLLEQVQVPSPSGYLFVDEAQDFSSLEMKLVRQWGSHCERYYLAGDDDQAIYRFKGASNEMLRQFTGIEARIQVLSQSYRVPRSIHAHATSWIDAVKERQVKHYLPRNAEGVCSLLSRDINRNSMEMFIPQIIEWSKKHSVMILASCSYMLKKILYDLRRNRVAFHNPYRPSLSSLNPLQCTTDKERIINRIYAFLQFSNGQLWTYRSLWMWASIISMENVMTRHAKVEMLTQSINKPDDQVELDMLSSWIPDSSHVECIARGDLQWFKRHALVDCASDTAYLCDMMSRKDGKTSLEKPKIIVGTIHSVKGAEADVVVLMPDVSRKFSQHWTDGVMSDDVRRLFYVGMTRAKKALYWTCPLAEGYSISRYM